MKIRTRHNYLGVYFSSGGITNNFLSCLADHSRLVILSLKYRLKQLFDFESCSHLYISYIIVWYSNMELQTRSSTGIGVFAICSHFWG